MFKVTDEEIEKLIYKEYVGALEKSRLFNSDHEFYAVLKEELEEVGECFIPMKNNLDLIWSEIREDLDIKYVIVNRIKKDSISCIKELLQVCAVCDKYIDKKGEEND